MCAQKISGWPGFSTWTKFRAKPGPIDEIVFDPLCTWSGCISTPAYGRIAESPQDCILALEWDSPKAYEEFKTSPQYQQLMANLEVNLARAHTQIMAFENNRFGYGLTSNTEILTAYWPASLSSETQDAVWKAETLVHTAISRMSNTRCYTQPPVFGWIDELQTWNDDKALASMWLHYWESEELEHKLKRNEKKVVSVGRDIIYPLAVDDFEQNLRDLSALGWESIHVDFEPLNWIYDDEVMRSYCRERRRLDVSARDAGTL